MNKQQYLLGLKQALQSYHMAQEEIEEIFSKYNNNSPISKKEWARYMYVSSIVGDDYLRSTLKRVMKKLEQQLNRRNE